MPLKHIAFYSSSPQQGKTTAANYLYRRGYKIIRFASPLKLMLEAFMTSYGLSRLQVEHFSKTAKEEIIPDIGKSYRYLARTLGTEWGRNIVDENVWTDAFMAKFRRISLNSLVCVDDLRFPNELDTLVLCGFTLIRITRNTNRDPLQDLHLSDTALAAYDSWDHVIDNNGSIDDLYSKIDAIIK